jgi:predicted AAA+ superfamily ATPase
MTIHQLRPWSQVVRLDNDVESGSTAVAAYAIDLGALVAGDPRIPRIYRQPRDFFAATYLTSGMRRLLGDVLDGLAGGTGDRVLQLRSPFGGGKSHTLAALYHAANDHAALAGSVIRRVTDPLRAEGVEIQRSLPDPGAVRVAVFDGEKFDVLGRQVDGQPVKTMWGALAAQLGCYDVVAYHDMGRVAPGGDVIARMLGDAPTLILLDEVRNSTASSLAGSMPSSGPAAARPSLTASHVFCWPICRSTSRPRATLHSKRMRSTC